MSFVRRATVKDFSRAAGTGTLIVEGRYELPFSAVVASTSRIAPGDAAEVHIRLDTWGRRTAEAVVLDEKEEDLVTFAEAYRFLRAAGFLREWKLADAKSAATELFGEVPDRVAAADSAALLASYYDMGATERAVEEGFLAHDWRYGQETGDIVAEFVRALRCPPATLVRIAEDGSLLIRDDAAGGVRVTVPSPLPEVASFFQQRLQTCGMEERLVTIETEGDWFAFAVRSGPVLAQLTTARAIAATLV